MLVDIDPATFALHPDRIGAAGWKYWTDDEVSDPDHALDVPALFVYSSLDWAVAAANEIREGWPEVPVKVMDGASHALFVDKPQEFNHVLEEFLASLPK